MLYSARRLQSFVDFKLFVIIQSTRQVVSERFHSNTASPLILVKLKDERYKMFLLYLITRNSMKPTVYDICIGAVDVSVIYSENEFRNYIT